MVRGPAVLHRGPNVEGNKFGLIVMLNASDGSVWKAFLHRMFIFWLPLTFRLCVNRVGLISKQQYVMDYITPFASCTMLFFKIHFIKLDLK